MRKREVFTCYFPSPYLRGGRKSCMKDDTATATLMRSRVARLFRIEILLFGYQGRVMLTDR